MAAEFVPTDAVAVFTLTVMVLLLEADAGVTASQPAFSLTLQLVFDVTASVWFAGLAAPWVAVNVRLLGLNVRVGAGAVSESVTFTVRVRPPPVTVIVPVLVPTVAVVWSTVTVTVPLFEPLAGLTVSQVRASVTLQDPLELIERDWLAGLAAPCVVVKVKLEEPTVKVGAGAATVNETGIDWGELVAPVPVTVIEAV
jgi:hypothetical protein